ncbi:unnamed protein product, partial [Ectocarpus sp. 12 AP-2014]
CILATAADTAGHTRGWDRIGAPIVDGSDPTSNSSRTKRQQRHKRLGGNRRRQPRGNEETYHGLAVTFPVLRLLQSFAHHRLRGLPGRYVLVSCPVDVA